MKRGYFVVLFFLLSFVFLYSDSSVAVQAAPESQPCGQFSAGACPSPQCKVATRETIRTGVGCQRREQVSVCEANPDFSGGYCYPENTMGLLNSPNSEIGAEFKYENVGTRWNLNIRDGRPSSVEVKRLLGGRVSDSILYLSKYPASDEHCEVSFFQFERRDGVLSYDLPFSRAETGADGGKVCFYAVTAEMAGEIASLGGVPTSINQICPDLQSGRTLSSPTAPCPTTERCEIPINQGETAYYGLTSDKDSCGKYTVGKLNNGAPIQAGDTSQAQEFINACAEKYKERDIKGNLLIYADIIKTGMGGYPEVKTNLEMEVNEIKDGELPKRAVFKTRIEGGGFTAVGDYKNTFIAGMVGVLSVYAETTPELFKIIKEAYENDKFIPTGPLMKISGDGKTIQEVYLIDTKIFTQIWDRKTTEWFVADIEVSMDFNEDGSVIVEVKSRTKSDKGGYDSGEKIYRTTVDRDRAKKILIDMLVRFELAKDKPLGEYKGNVEKQLVQDLEGVRKMISEGRIIKGNKIPITQTGLMFKEDDTFDKRVDYIKREIDDLLKYLNSIRTGGPRTSLDEEELFIFGAGTEYA